MPHFSEKNSQKIWTSPHGRALPSDFRSRTLLMGIVNATPDSFSDGGEFLVPENAAKHASKLVSEGADIIDIGAESTRPGSEKIDENEEIRRLLPALKAIRSALPSTPISVDTYRAKVAEAAIEAGADILNDVCAIRSRGEISGTRYEMGELAARLNAPLIAMHNRFGNDEYGDFWSEFLGDLNAGIERILKCGVPEQQIWLDPGFGFGKSPAQNLQIVERLGNVVEIGFPVLLGTSRKSTLGKILGGKAPKERVGGDAACSAIGALNGAACLRLHDPAKFVDVVKTADAIFAVKHGLGNAL